MQRKERFPPEADTQPDVLRAKPIAQQVRVPLKSRRAEPTEAAALEKAPTVRPPPRDDSRPSHVRKRRGDRTTSAPAATVDEVVADMTRDPRRERDED
jgi:hypothetical protein